MSISLYLVKSCLLIVTGIFFISFSTFAAQPQMFGQLIIEGNDAVQVDDFNVTKEVTVRSGVKIATSINSGARVNFGEVGRIDLASDSQMILNFQENKISGTLKKGKLKISTAPNIEINIQTPGGIVTNSDLTTNTIFEVDYVRGKTQLLIDCGTVTLNGKIVPVSQEVDSIPAADNVKIEGFYFSVLDTLVKSLYLEKTFDESFKTNVPFDTDISDSSESFNVGPVR